MPPAERDQLGAVERQNVPYILSVLDEFQVPITWATVGHLFLASCACDAGRLPHADMPRPPFNGRWQGDWYRHDPCTDLQRDPLWYCPDLIEQVMKSKVAHEIGSHTFSHIDFSARTSNRDLVKREIEACLSVMAPLGLKLRSLVYPYNNKGHAYHDLLHQYGIIAVRHRDDKIRLSYPERSAAGVYKIYESMNLRSANYYRYRDKAELFISHAIEHGAAYHLWFHPSDPTEVFRNEFCEILQILRRERELGNLWTTTMGELAAYCEARENVSLRSSTNQNTKTLEIQSTLDTDKYGTPEITLVIPSQALPKRIQQEVGSTVKELTPAQVCSVKRGALVLNVPAVAQTVSLIF